MCEEVVQKTPEDGVLLEFRRVGNAVKVSAIDQNTGTEISIVGPYTAGKTELTRTAIQKLKYVMAKNN